MTPDHKSADPDLYWAVILRHRWASWCDNPELCLIGERGGLLDGPSVRRIAGSYSVARGLRLLPESEETNNAKQNELIKAKRAQQLADRLNAVFTIMPEAIDERSEYLLQAHDEVSPYFHRRQLSALSKFAWFARPKSWTMFDSLASKALGVSDYEGFYARLIELEFRSLVAAIGDALGEQALRFHPERVVDQFLLLKGSAQPNNGRQIARAYLGSLPTDLGSKLHDVATAIAAAADKHQLIQAVR